MLNLGSNWYGWWPFFTNLLILSKTNNFGNLPSCDITQPFWKNNLCLHFVLKSFIYQRLNLYANMITLLPLRYFVFQNSTLKSNCYLIKGHHASVFKQFHFNSRSIPFKPVLTPLSLTQKCIVGLLLSLSICSDKGSLQSHICYIWRVW